MPRLVLFFRGPSGRFGGDYLRAWGRCFSPLRARLPPGPKPLGYDTDAAGLSRR